jgi:hypothetical protein
MRTGMVWLLSGGTVLCGGRCAWAQAGRFVPRVNAGGGGGGGGHAPHFLFHFFGEDIVWLLGLVLALVVLAKVGYCLGYALGGGGKRSGNGRAAGKLKARPIPGRNRARPGPGTWV